MKRPKKREARRKRNAVLRKIDVEEMGQRFTLWHRKCVCLFKRTVRLNMKILLSFTHISCVLEYFRTQPL